MEIRKVESDKKQFLELLLLADEQEDMIDKYLERGTLYALFDDDLKSVCVVTKESDTTCELKNLATYPCYQKCGYGRKLVLYLFEQYQDSFDTMFVGTGNNPDTIGFYEGCGFRYSHIKENFFVDHYIEPIFENGVQLIDMIYLRKEFRSGKM
ncbi:MAG: GNAT family N-acetyltransferase [Oscillospiraceae bacterium]